LNPDYEVAAAVKIDLTKRAEMLFPVRAGDATKLHQLRGDELSHSTIRARWRTDGCPSAGRGRGNEVSDVQAVEPLGVLRDHRLWTAIAPGWPGAQFG